MKLGNEHILILLFFKLVGSSVVLNASIVKVDETRFTALTAISHGLVLIDNDNGVFTSGQELRLRAGGTVAQCNNIKEYQVVDRAVSALGLSLIEFKVAGVLGGQTPGVAHEFLLVLLAGFGEGGRRSERDFPGIDIGGGFRSEGGGVGRGHFRGYVGSGCVGFEGGWCLGVEHGERGGHGHAGEHEFQLAEATEFLVFGSSCFGGFGGFYEEDDVVGFFVVFAQFAMLSGSQASGRDLGGGAGE